MAGSFDVNVPVKAGSVLQSIRSIPGSAKIFPSESFSAKQNVTPILEILIRPKASLLAAAIVVLVAQAVNALAG